MKFGIQLYSIKDEIKEHGLDEMLRIVKEAGYDYVELAGYYGLSPDELSAALERQGLIAYCAHIVTSGIEEALPYIDRLGIKRVYVPVAPFDMRTDEGFEKTVIEMERASKLLASRGVSLGYHNHEMEFEGGIDRVWRLLERVPSITSELDIFWARAAGLSPVALMKKYGARLDALHVKDIDSAWDGSVRASEYPCAIIGEGLAECEASVGLAADMGIDLLILEVEGFPCDAFEYLKKSNENMRKYASKEK